MKYRGMIGFVEVVQKRPGVQKLEPVEYPYSGEVLKRSVKYQNGLSVNDAVSPQHQISILADPYLRNHVGSMRYVKWMGTAWKISDISMQYPRMILTLGGVYNGATAN